MSACSMTEVILLGSFLLMAWSSLRFSDAQCIEMARMVLTDSDLRGIVWRSKTTTLGMPFGAINSGLLSKGAHSWMWEFIKTMDTILMQNDVSDVDFLIPHCDTDTVTFPLVPMTYARALFHMRRMIQCPWRSSAAKPFHVMQCSRSCVVSVHISVMCIGSTQISAVIQFSLQRP